MKKTKKTKINKDDKDDKVDKVDKSALLADKVIEKGREHDQEQLIKSIQEKVPIDAFKKWYLEEYSTRTNNLTIDKKALCGNCHESLYDGVLIRTQNISILKYLYQYNTMDMIIVVMKLYDNVARKETNYGTLFCELLSSINPIRIEFISTKNTIGNVAFTYYSATPSYISCDGEYRAQFSTISSLEELKRTFPEIWNEIDEYVTRIRIRRQWSPYTNYFYPKMEQELKNTEVEYAVRNEMYPNTLLNIAWFCAIYDEFYGLTKTHINAAFKEIFLREKDADLAFLKDLMKKYSEEVIDKFHAALNFSPKNFHGASRYLQCGYKMIPLNIKEVQDPLKIKYKPWREYFASNRCNDLVINGICPSFSIILDWFYIKNSRKGLFDNVSQYERMKNSELAKNILQILYEAQRNTYFASESLEVIGKTKEEIKKWIHPKFRKLNDKIEDPIEYSISEIIMSEVSLAFASEFIGRTIADTVYIVQTSKIYNKMIGLPFEAAGYNYFCKYMFEICYALFCMNSKFGLMHGDFHLNNATIGALYHSSPEVAQNKGEKYKVVYYLPKTFSGGNANANENKSKNGSKNENANESESDSENETAYIFPNNGYFGCVIDFSRSIINPYHELKTGQGVLRGAEIFADKGLPPNYKPIKDADEDRFNQQESNTLLNLYMQLFPSKVKQKEELSVVFKNNFNAVFKLLTCIDLYMFSVRLQRILNEMPGINKLCVDLVDELNRMSEHFIASEMNKIINDNSYAKVIEQNDYPMLTIIKKCFANFAKGTEANSDTKGNKSNATKLIDANSVIIDIYRYSNAINHSLERYASFPDFLKYVKYDGKEVKEVAEKRRLNREQYEKIKINNLEMMSYIALRHTQKLV